MKKLALGLIGVFLFSTAAANTDHDFYTFDKSHTQVILKVNHLGFSNFYMEAMDYDGGFYFDKEAIEDSIVTVNIDANSIKSDSEKLDEHLKGKDFFNSEEFPEITFKASEVEMIDETSGQLKGTLTIKDISKPLTLDVVFNKADVNPFTEAYHAGFSATGVIKRSDYDITYALPAVSDEVEIVLEVEGIRQ